MTQKKWFQGLVAAVLTFTLILLISKAGFIFRPLATYLAAIAFPMIAAGLLFYITKPLVRLLEKIRFPKWVAILTIFLLLIGLVYIVFQFAAPIVQNQYRALVNNIPGITNEITSIVNYWEENHSALPDQVEESIQDYAKNLQSSLSDIPGYLISFISSLVNFVLSLVLIPFFLFFMLKDGDKLIPFVTKFFDKKKGASVKKLMEDVNHTLASFIQGQFIVSVCVGTMLFIGYAIIDLNYAFTLAVIGLVFNVIPFLGPYLAAAPAILVAFFQEPKLAILAAIIMLIAQQIEGNLISPNVMGKVLSIHPLTVITLILAAGNIAGFLGLLFVIPFYAVCKVIISHFYREWVDYRMKKKSAAGIQAE
ncbi:Predicted PurR-regulated permease PerM [Terribacillus halophilus]|uniref:Predicted PurR-regulated permease PerM n=1 Tax=Terribacillus halophilus TaxID=361279 RepID=A0A1G6I674_9BACI|nr:AI-2E family transporter [Terribacillus halophilus]SDC01941.1 Predicted PurR-regulated permease PerM [Terribacillus halophilus]